MKKRARANPKIEIRAKARVKEAATFKVTYERDDESRWWTAFVQEHPGAITQGRTIEEARRRVREALAALLDDDALARRATLVDDVHLPPKLQAAVERSRKAAQHREQADREARESQQKAIRSATSFRLSLKDTATLLGVSRQRIHQRKRTVAA